MVGSASGPIGIWGFCSSVKRRKKPKNISSCSGCVTEGEINHSEPFIDKLFIKTVIEGAGLEEVPVTEKVMVYVKTVLR
jgi:hypothetical protein